jgi:alpha/beta superfamily hydrolase
VSLPPLPRRAFLGAELPADDRAFGPGGLRIAGVRAGGMAGAAGLAAGDRLTALAGAPVRDLAELGHALRLAGAADRAELRYRRGDVDHAETVDVIAAPRETLAGQRLSYESIDRPGGRLRAIVSEPASGPARGAILLVQGIACESIEANAGPTAPLVDLVRGLAGAGYVSVRFDKRGVGDSDGGPCAAADFTAELADARAAVDWFARDLRTAGLPRFLLGHSVGGTIAALLAPELAGADLIVSGSSPAPWLDCVVASTRRQLALRGAPSADIDARARALRDRALTDGINGRSGAYHRQLAAVDVGAAWRAVAGRRLLIVRGGCDWVVGADDQARLAELVGAGATVLDIPGADHLLAWHPDRASSLRDYGTGALAPAIVARCLEWMRARPV